MRSGRGVAGASRSGNRDAWPSRRGTSGPHGLRGFTLIEVLVVMAILGVVAGIIAFSAMQSARNAEQRAAVNSISQLFWQGTTAAASRGITAELVRAGDTLTVRSSVDHSIIRELELPAGVTATIPVGGPLLLFRAPGRIEFVSGGLVSPFEVRALGTRHRLTLSTIGEVRTEVVR